jgi:hypothetical protein
MVPKESTSATNIDANLKFLDLMSFSSSAGEDGILDKESVEEPEPAKRWRIGRLRVRSKDMFCSRNAVAG